MNIKRWTRCVTFTSAAFLLAVACSAVRAQVTQLATWDTPPTGSVFPGGDFDPTLDNMATCSGCWYSRTASSGVTYSRSVGNGTTQGTGALQATIVGKGAGG